MAKQKLTAGKDIDILTAGEVRSLLREWQVDVSKGLRPVLFNASGTASAGGAIELGGPVTLTGGQLGPLPAFWWAVTRLAVRVNGAAAGAFSVGIGATHVRDVPVAANGFASFGAQELLVGNASTLTVGLAGAAASAVVQVTGAAVEIPQALLWRWLAG
jgi:hypothetical protein